MASEFYDVGKGRGRPEIDSTNRVQASTRIQAFQEDAMVVDHDNNRYEVYASGKLVGQYNSGVDAQNALRKATGDK